MTQPLKSANGYLDLVQAWTWSSAEIIQWLDRLILNANDYGVESKYLGSLEDASVNHKLNLGFLVEYIKYLSTKGRISDPFYCVGKFKQDPAVKVDKFPEFNYPTPFNGKDLPIRTLYDAVGWILSITATPGKGDPDPDNFYLPLILLFGRWCTVLLDSAVQPTMLHIAWWVGGQNNKLRVLLGATPGNDQKLWNQDAKVWHAPPAPNRDEWATKPRNRDKKDSDSYWGFRGWDVISKRQDFLEDSGISVPNESRVHLVNFTGKYEANSGYGRCAETMIYLYMAQLRKAGKKVPKVKGFAINPKTAEVASASTAEDTKVSRALTDPCATTCQRVMMKDFDEGPGGQKCLFMLDHLDLDAAVAVPKSKKK